MISDGTDVEVTVWWSISWSCSDKVFLKSIVLEVKAPCCLNSQALHRVCYI